VGVAQVVPQAAVLAAGSGRYHEWVQGLIVAAHLEETSQVASDNDTDSDDTNSGALHQYADAAGNSSGVFAVHPTVSGNQVQRCCPAASLPQQKTHNAQCLLSVCGTTCRL
jgi:hypothetical protein